MQQADEDLARREAARLLGKKGGKVGGARSQSKRATKKRITSACRAGLASWAARRADPEKFNAWQRACLEGRRRKTELRKALLDAQRVADEVVSVKP